MSDLYLAIWVIFLSVVVVLQQVILSKIRRDLDVLIQWADTAKSLTVGTGKALQSLSTSTLETFEAQAKLNTEIHKLLMMHHVSLGLNTGIANEVSKFLDEEKDKK